MKKKNPLFLLVFLLGIILGSCTENKQANYEPFDPSKPIKVTSFYPDSGGIATPIIIEGSNFGSDTVGLKVYFVDELGTKHRAGVVSSNGSKIYAMVPKLTYLRNLDVVVERTAGSSAQPVSGKSPYSFVYKTQTAVTTVVGKPDPGNTSVNTVGGDFSIATLSSPFGICLDDEDNIFITERVFWFQNGGYSGQSPKDDKGTSVQSNLLMADQKNQILLVLKYSVSYANSPAYSNEKGNEAVYIPSDAGPDFTVLNKSLSYTPRFRSVILDDASRTMIEGNWKYSFVVNKVDHQIYTVMWKGQLVRINPVTRNVEILLNNVCPSVPNGNNGTNGSNVYCAFSSIDPNMLYMCMEDYNLIKRVDISALADKDKATYKGEDYAGYALFNGPVAGRGWEDGLLYNAKFYAPKQISFTADGKMYIADTGNHCIRIIDTTVSQNLATVNTAVGLPQNPGFQDGGPEFAKFNCPAGVAVNSNGSVIYVADTKNHVVRKLSIE